MSVVGVGNITLFDQNDAPTASLSLDRCGLPADAAGVVTDFSAAVTTLSILIGGYDDSAAWSVSVVKSAGVLGTLAGKTFTVTGLSTDAGYVDFTATRPGFANLTKRFDLGKMKQGVTGDAGTPGAPGVDATAEAIYLPLDSVSGGVTPDASGNGKNGTVTGATLGEGLFGNCLIFDGNDYVQLPGIPISTEITYSVWYKKTVDANMYLLDHRATEVGCYPIYIDSANLIHFNDSVNGDCVSSFAAAKSDGRWHNIVCIGTASSMKIFHDLVLVGSAAFGVTVRAATAVFVGTRHTLASYFQGSLDEVKIYPRAITDAERSDIYSANPETIGEYLPGYLGKFNKDNSEAPTNPRKGEFWVVYGSNDTGTQRGVWLRDITGTSVRLTSESARGAFCMLSAMADVMWVIETGQGAWGTVSTYSYGTIFENLFSNSIASNFLYALAIVVGKSIRGGNAYDEDGNLIDPANPALNGFWLGGSDSMFPGLAKLANAIITGSLDAVGGTFKGLVQNSTLFNMRKAETAGSAIAFPAKTRWKSSVLYDALTTVAEDGVFDAAAGTLGALTVDGVARTKIGAGFSSRALLRTVAAGTYPANQYSWLTVDSWTATVSDPGCLLIAGISNVPWTIFAAYALMIQKNGVTLIEDTRNDDFSLSVITDVTAGDVLTVRIGNMTGNAGTLNKLNVWSGEGKRLFARFSNGTFSIYPYDRYYSANIALTSPIAWTAAANLNFAPGSTYVTAMSAYTENEKKAVSAAAFVVNEVSKTLAFVSRPDKSKARVYFTDATYVDFVGDSAEGATVGWYNASGSYTLLSATNGLETVALEPFVNNTHDIGTTTKKYKDLHLSGAANVASVAASGAVSGASLSATGSEGARTAGSYSLYATKMVTAAASSYTKMIEFKIKKTGTYTTYLGFTRGVDGGTTYARVYKNGSAVGTARSTAGVTTVWFSENIAFVSGDLIQLYGYNSVGGTSEYYFNIRTAEEGLA